MQKGRLQQVGDGGQAFDNQAVFETLLSFVLYFFGFLASVIVFSQCSPEVVLYLGYALTPIFVAHCFLGANCSSRLDELSTRTCRGNALAVGVGAAAIMTQGLLDFMADQSFFRLAESGELLDTPCRI